MNTLKKPSVVVAIPAWNEEKNIVSLLKSIRRQEKNYFTLSKVLVYSDGSTDNTVKLIRENFKDVIVHNFKNNLGKNKRVNQILRDFKEDVLIQIDADIKIRYRNVFDNLIKPFYQGRNPGIVCAYHLASPPEKFFEKIAYFGFLVWDRSRSMLGENGIRYYCEGGLRAFSHDFTRKFRLPDSNPTGEDSFSFYYAISNGFSVEVAKNSKVFIDLASNLKDYSRQMKRFLIDPQMVTENFNNPITEKYEILNYKQKFKALLIEALRNPLVGILYITVQSMVKIQMPFFRPQTGWTPITRK